MNYGDAPASTGSWPREFPARNWAPLGWSRFWRWERCLRWHRWVARRRGAGRWSTGCRRTRLGRSPSWITPGRIPTLWGGDPGFVFCQFYSFRIRFGFFGFFCFFFVSGSSFVFGFCFGFFVFVFSGYFGVSCWIVVDFFGDLILGFFVLFWIFFWISFRFLRFF